jgi:DNA repair exonuclease SbcCD ATPase subunit
MEILLAILLAVAIVTGAWLWAERKNALARERRLREEIGGMKRTSLIPLAATSSPDFLPLFPEPSPENLPVPEPPVAAESSEPGKIASPSPSVLSVPVHLLDEAERHRNALRALDERLSRPRVIDAGTIAAVPASQSPGHETGADRLSASVAEVGSAVEPFIDQSTRLRNDLQAVGAATARVLEALEAALPLAREAAHQTEALSPFVSSLSGFADRLNLLSLDITLGTETPTGESTAPQKEASVEIRTLFDEVRTFSRNLGARVRKATESARRSEEAFCAVRDTANGARERSTTASGRGDRLSATATFLEETMEALRSASDAARLEWEKLVRAHSALEQRLTAERQIAQRRAHETAASAQVEEVAREVVREERQAAEELAVSLRAIASR